MGREDARGAPLVEERARPAALPKALSASASITNGTGAVAGVEAAHAAGMRCIAVAGNRDLPGLRKAELMVKDLTEVDVKRIHQLGQQP